MTVCVFVIIDLRFYIIPVYIVLYNFNCLLTKMCIYIMMSIYRGYFFCNLCLEIVFDTNLLRVNVCNEGILKVQ